MKKRLLKNTLVHTEGGADEHGYWEASKIMRMLGSFLVFGVALISGCGGKHYIRGHGDVGQFIFQHAITYGGRPVATNGLASIGGDWQFIQDEYGVGVLLPASQFQRVQDFVRAAFGPPSNSAGWPARDFGVTIMVQQAGAHTSVGIYPAMSEEKVAQGIREMTRDMEKKQ